MEHTLDNPIWNALSSGSKQFSNGNARAKYLKRDMGLFAGMRENTSEDFAALAGLTPAQERVVLFTPGEVTIPPGWVILLSKPLLQMVYSLPDAPTNDADDLILLDDDHIPAMIDLTSRTNPGPFLSRTIDFGNYEGIFEERKLLAMTGQRLQPDPYTEVSAVCTDPEYTGRGYAARLIRSQITKIVNAGRIPFLHVLPDNTGAVHLYDKLGFRTRREIRYYVLEKQ